MPQEVVPLDVKQFIRDAAINGSSRVCLGTVSPRSLHPTIGIQDPNSKGLSVLEISYQDEA